MALGLHHGNISQEGVAPERAKGAQSENLSDDQKLCVDSKDTKTPWLS
jgi:hypothetical protein